jgi:hypothetical protein
MGLCRFPAFLIALTAPNIVYWLTSHIDHSTVRLWRYFSKVTLIHGAIAELDSAARSTRLYRLFRKKRIPADESHSPDFQRCLDRIDRYGIQQRTIPETN